MSPAHAPHLVGLLALTLAISAGGCERRGAEGPSAEPSDAEKRGGLAVVCTQAAPESLDPFLSPDLGVGDLRPLLFTPLVLYDTAGGFRPYLAREWAWEDAQRKLTLRIRSDVRWHDGTPLTAEDVAWTVRTAANPEYGYRSPRDFSAVREAVARDSVTVEFRFSEPVAAGLEPFIRLPILPRHLLGSLGPAEFRQAEYHRAPVGSGPFKFAGRRPDGSFQFDRWDGFPPELGQLFLDRIVLRAIPEATTLLVELETGSVDLCVTGSALAEKVQGSSRLQLFALEPAAIQVIYLNTRHAPLNDARVRRALSAAVRRSDIAAVTSSLARPARTPLPSTSPWLDRALGQPDDDSALAVSLLESAGWTAKAADGPRRDAAGQPLRLTLLAPQQLEAPVTALQAHLRRVGVALDLRFMEWAAYVATILNPNTRPDAMALGSYPDRLVYPDLYDQLHSKAPRNLSSYSNASVDSAIERLRTPLPPEERAGLYREIQRRVAEDAPILYLVYVPRLAVAGPRLPGVRVDFNGPFASVAEWWIPPRQRVAGR